MNTPVFVYGTLMKGFANHAIIKNHIIATDRGWIQGCLYHLDYGYPALIPGNDQVAGEIYWLRDMEKLMPQLDWVEDFNQPNSPDMYKRVLYEVTDTKGLKICCYVYFWSPERCQELYNHGTYLKEGDWRLYRGRGKETF